MLLPWYPGARGGKAVADILFGKCSPSGKLPITFYKDLEGMPEFTDYTMKGRTYRFMEGEALYPFGYGLSYADIDVKSVSFATAPKTDEDITLKVIVANASDIAAEEVVQVYVKDLESANAVKNTSLCCFKRIAMQPKEEKEITLTVSAKALEAVDEKGDRYRDSNRFTLYVGCSQPDGRSTALTGKKPVELQVEL